MMSDSHLAPQYVQSSKRFPWGCLLTGCAATFLLMIGLVIGSGVAGYFFVKSQITKYTAEAPRDLPEVEYSPEEIQDITNRVETFKKSLEKGDTPPPPMILTANDINALISQQEQLRGRVFVKVDDGQVTADVSFPLDDIPGAQGRYFNGSVSANVSLENGVLIVTLADAEVKGQKVPQQIIDAMSKENLAKDVYKNPDVAKTLSKFDRGESRRLPDSNKDLPRSHRSGWPCDTRGAPASYCFSAKNTFPN